MPRPDGKNGSVTVPMPLLEEINETARLDAEKKKLLRPDSASKMVEVAWRFYLANRPPVEEAPSE